MSCFKRSLLTVALVTASAVLLISATAWTGPPDGQGKSGDRELAESLSAHLKPWHPFQDEWDKKASLVLLGTYKEQTGPCITFPDGTRVMPLNGHFVDLEVLKGRVAVDNILFDTPPQSTTDRRLPLGLIKGQRYLLFLAPNDETAKQLLDAENKWGVPVSGALDELLAIVDLAQTEQEAQLYDVEGTKSASYQGVEFTPAKWQQLRKSDPVDLETQKRLQAVIQNAILKNATTLADVRCYLGVPDDCKKTADSLDYIYLMNQYGHHEVPHDQIVTRVELDARPDTRLIRARIVHLWLTVERGGSFTSFSCGDMTPEALEKHGLKNVTWEYAR